MVDCAEAAFLATLLAERSESPMMWLADSSDGKTRWTLDPTELR